MQVRFYVGGIPYYYDNQELKKHFLKRGYDPIKVEVAEDEGRRRGFAHVTLEFPNEEAALHFSRHSRKLVGFPTELPDSFNELSTEELDNLLRKIREEDPSTTIDFVDPEPASNPGGNFVKDIMAIAGNKSPTREEVAIFLGGLTKEFILAGANYVHWKDLDVAIVENDESED